MIKKQFLIFALLCLNLFNHSFAASAVTLAKDLQYRDPQSLPFDPAKLPDQLRVNDWINSSFFKQEVALVYSGFESLNPQTFVAFKKDRDKQSIVVNCRLARIGKNNGRYCDYTNNDQFENATPLMEFVYQNGEYGENETAYNNFLKKYLAIFGGSDAQDIHGRNPWHYAAMKENLAAMQALAEDENPIFFFSPAFAKDKQGQTPENYIEEKIVESKALHGTGFISEKRKAILAVFAEVRKRHEECIKACQGTESWVAYSN